MELNQQTIEEIYKEIRSHKDYMKHAKLQNEYKRCGQWAKAALEGKILKDMEQAVWAEVAKQYIDRTQITMDVVASMSDEDRHKMNILANSIVMLADVLDNLVMDTDSILKKYVTGKNTELVQHDPIKLIRALTDVVYDQYKSRFRPDMTLEQRSLYEKNILLSVIDYTWINHIDAMSKLRNGIHLRAYAQKDPLQEYTEEGFSMFESMNSNIAILASLNVS